MYRALPAIAESADELHALLKAERHPKKHQRLHALYLVASGQARTKQSVAALLGVHRDTIGAWMATYVDGGLSAYLDLYVPSGRAPAVPPEVEAELVQALQRPEGFASYSEIQTWLRINYSIQMQYKALHKLVHHKLNARPKVARPSHRKKTGGRDRVSGPGGSADPGRRATGYAAPGGGVCAG